MTEYSNNTISSRDDSKDFLTEIADEIDKAFINSPQLKPSMIGHTKKVIKTAGEYRQYLRTEWQKAKDAGLTLYDENKDKEEWFWWTGTTNGFMWHDSVYFADVESFDVQFYIKGKPEPDPLSYLSRSHPKTLLRRITIQPS